MAGAAAVVVAVLGVGSLLRDGGGTVATFEQMAPEAGADPTADQTFDTEEDTATLQADAGPRYGRRREHGVHGRRRGHGVHGCSRRCRRQHEPHRQRTGGDAPARGISIPFGRRFSPCEGEIDRDHPSEETALVCVDQVRPDRPGSEIDLVALLTVGDDEVEVYVVLNDSGERAALAYRTSDCTLIAER